MINKMDLTTALIDLSNRDNKAIVVLTRDQASAISEEIGRLYDHERNYNALIKSVRHSTDILGEAIGEEDK